MQRVQIPAYADRWMMGDRFGVIVKTSWTKPDLRAALLTKKPHERQEIAHVKLDISGKTVRVILNDCTLV